MKSCKLTESWHRRLDIEVARAKLLRSTEQLEKLEKQCTSSSLTCSLSRQMHGRKLHNVRVFLLSGKNVQSTSKATDAYTHLKNNIPPYTSLSNGSFKIVISNGKMVILGEGAYGKVVLGFYNRLKCAVAIKFLRHNDDPSTVREAMVLQALCSSPYFPYIYGVMIENIW